MKTKDVIIESKVDGQKVPGKLMICECGNDTFVLFVLEGKHQHIQCRRCDFVYCDGTCANVGRAN